jgi:hypothetical protein
MPVCVVAVGEGGKYELLLGVGVSGEEGIGDVALKEEGFIFWESARLLGACSGGDAFVGGIDSSINEAQEERSWGRGRIFKVGGTCGAWEKRSAVRSVSLRWKSWDR